jgi:hypothetical protein
VNSVYLLTCHGQPPNGAFLPPTILVSGLGNNGGTPHSVSSKSTSQKTLGKLINNRNTIDRYAESIYKLHFITGVF